MLREWGIERKVLTITLDNASANNGLVDVVKCHLNLTGTLLCQGEFFHVRCGAHILNLIVQSGLKMIEKCVNKIRENVKYVKGTKGRLIKFAECVAQLSLKSSKKLRQDVPTRWNSTYLMLDSALTYKLAFYQLQLVDSNFKDCATEEEWKTVEKIAKFLKPFHDITTLFSGTQYPTSNLYFHGVWKIQSLIYDEMDDPSSILYYMAIEMNAKFEKYWECYSLVLSFAVILDPRFKLEFVEFVFKKLYPRTYNERVKSVRDKLSDLYKDYCRFSTYSSTSGSSRPTFYGDNEDDIDDMDASIVYFLNFEDVYISTCIYMLTCLFLHIVKIL